MLPGRAPDEPQWDRYANALHDSAIAAMKAAERQDKAGLLKTGGDIYAACTACHKRYVLGER
jgi:cytochrome c556